MQIVKSEVARRTDFSSRIGLVGIPSLYEMSIPAHPLFVDEWAGRAPAGTTPNPTYVGIGDDSAECDEYRIGIISDVHENGRAYRALLQRFGDEGARAVFLLGDYSYTLDEDHDGTRAAQLDDVLSATADWLSEHPGRESVVLMGNHEIDRRYYADDASHDRVRGVVARWQSNPRMHFAADPFRSYEVDNAVDVVCFFGDHRRSFRLTHAVTEEFVYALFAGIEDRHIARAQDKIKSYLGTSWLNYQLKVREATKARWSSFLASAVGTTERRRLGDEVQASIKAGLQCERYLQDLVTSESDAGRQAGNYRYLVKRALEDPSRQNPWARELASFWGPPDRMELEVVSPEFALDLRRFHSALGVGRMYSICGHFHADLGMFESSQLFGTYLIGSGGLQPGKRISESMCGYVLRCTPDCDTLDRYSIVEAEVSE